MELYTRMWIPKGVIRHRDGLRHLLDRIFEKFPTRFAVVDRGPISPFVVRYAPLLRENVVQGVEHLARALTVSTVVF